MSNALQLYESTRLLCPWDSPGKNISYVSCTGWQVLYHWPRVTTNSKSQELETLTVYANFTLPAYLITSHRK